MDEANVDLQPGEGLPKNHAAFVTLRLDLYQICVKLLSDLNDLGDLQAPDRLVPVIGGDSCTLRESAFRRVAVGARRE
jgi:hypothetical protein